MKPPFGTFKVNCDGAWCSSTGVGGFGWVVRDFARIFQDDGGVRNVRCVSSVMAETKALRAALVACVERGFGVVQVETDSKVLLDMINGILQPEAVLEGILWDVNHIKQQFYSVQFLYAPRACNEASYVMRMGDSHLWDGLEPERLFNTLATDVNISIRI
ncbi:uncharacterized protein [Pyrus communis]|uniref:uncharacterized protein n=1 Tax=Pyrus communis TaxID=23211 RepID=UPI0035BFB875